MAFKAKFWNIGAESQLLMGAIFGTWVGLNWGPALPGPVIVPLMFLAGFIGGALWGLIPAVLKLRFAINEVISTLMLNYICAEFLTLLIVGPWKSPKKFGFPYTDDLPASAMLSLLPGSRIHTFTLILALVAMVVLTVMLFKSRFGYEVRVIGENPDAAKYAGHRLHPNHAADHDYQRRHGRHGWSGGSGRPSPLFELSGYDFLGLRLHRHHRGLAGQTQPLLCCFFGDFFRRHSGWRRCDSDLIRAAGGYRGYLQWNPADFPDHGRFFYQEQGFVFYQRKRSDPWKR